MKKKILLPLAALLAAADPIHASFFADAVISYTPGASAGAFTNPTAALGEPSPITGAGSGFDNVFSPFSPHYETTDLTTVGAGGHLTLRLARFVIIDRTPGVREIGVWENVGLADADFPNGTASTPASVFGADHALVEVSADNLNWFALNAGAPILFTLPGNYFINAGPFDTGAPANPQFADFGQPFNGTLASFDGQNFAQILGTLGGSAGGTWLDLDSAPLAQVGYVRFSGVAAGETLEIDAVAINTAVAGAAVPEPGTAALCACGLAIAIASTRRRRTASIV